MHFALFLNELRYFRSAAIWTNVAAVDRNKGMRPETTQSYSFPTCTDLLPTFLENKASTSPVLPQVLFTSVDSMKSQESICAELIAETPLSMLSLIL